MGASFSAFAQVVATLSHASFFVYAERELPQDPMVGRIEVGGLLVLRDGTVDVAGLCLVTLVGEVHRFDVVAAATNIERGNGKCQRERGPDRHPLHGGRSLKAFCVLHKAENQGSGNGCAQGAFHVAIFGIRKSDQSSLVPSWVPPTSLFCSGIPAASSLAQSAWTPARGKSWSPVCAICATLSFHAQRTATRFRYWSSR